MILLFVVTNICDLIYLFKTNLEDHLQSILEEAARAADPASRNAIYEKYLRFWTLMEKFVAQVHVDKK